MTFACRCAGLLLIASLALADRANAQPFVVDDSGLAPDGVLQMEVWHHPYESWLVPSAQVAPGVDLVGGVALLHASPLGAEQLALDLQSKWQVRPLLSGWSAALVGGGTAELPTTDFRASDPFTVYAYGVAGAPAFGGQLTAYPNLGWTHTQGDGHALSWGLRADLLLSSSVILVGEAYGTGTAPPGYQAGLQIYPGLDWLELDATVSHDVRNGTRQTWITLGLVAVLGTGS